jgi:hypothetical protein
VAITTCSSKNKNPLTFDSKTQKYLDEVLDCIEENFSGKSSAMVVTDSGEKKIEFFDRIKTSEKNYYKNFRIDDQWLIVYLHSKWANEGNFPDRKDAIEEGKAIFILESEEEEEQPRDYLQEDSEQKILFKFENDDQEINLNKVGIEESEESEEDQLPETSVGEEFVMYEDKKDNKKIKSYHIKFGEEIDTEEVKHALFRRKKVQDLGKLASHIFMFSDVDSSEYYELNRNSYIKAWGILHYFRNKSQHSPLYDEVENMLVRNFNGKRISHKLFNNLFTNLKKISIERDYRFTNNPKCFNTGWYLDFSIAKGKQSKLNYLGIRSRQKLGIIFSLKEDICYNMETNSEQQLAINSLMIKQLENLSNYKVVTISESEFQRVENMYEYLDRLISWNFMKLDDKSE